MVDENKPEIEKEGSVFNVAIATLMRLDNILINIKDLVLDNKIGVGEKQHKKFRLVRVFYVQSVALIKDPKYKTDIKALIKKLEPIFKKVMSGGQEINVPSFNWDFENNLDDILVMIQEALQDEGYFMPQKFDKGL